MPPFCDGLTRRDALRVGTASLFGPAVGLPQLLAARAAGGTHKDVSLIFVFLHGGLSTIDTFDMKPDAPAEFRGGFNPAKTKIPGLDICDLLPQVAQQVDKFSLVRSFRPPNSDHGPADPYILTGYFPVAGFNPNLSPNNQRPCVGSVVSRKLGPRGSVPAYVALPKMHPSGGPAYLGASHAPFVIDADPSAPTFSVPDLMPPPVIAADRPHDPPQPPPPPDRVPEGGEAPAHPPPRGRAGRPPQAPRHRGPVPEGRRGPGQPARRGGRGVPRQGVRPDDLEGGEAGVRHRRRAGEAPRRVRPPHPRPELPDGPAAR